MNNLLILGAGGHGRVVRETAEAMKFFPRIDFLDDNSEIAIGKLNKFHKFTNEYNYAFVAIGNNLLREKWMNQIQNLFKLPVLIHPISYISPTANICDGTIICAGAIINTNSTIGKGSIISIGAKIDHDCIIGNYTHINAGAIVKSNTIVDDFIKVDAGVIFSG
ncbi:PglB [Caloramator mitchellensis]|nr:PglB [Caloramator mitchellensis]